jgi:hypothetical protein
MAQWYYRIRDEEFGPVQDVGLAALLADGTLAPTDDVRVDGEDVWQSLSVALSTITIPQSDEWSAGELEGLLGTEAPVRARTGNSAIVEELTPHQPDEASALDLEAMLGASGVETTAPRAAHVPTSEPVVEEHGDGWYYKSLGQELGPVAFPELMELVANGELTPNDFVRPGRNGAWQRAARIHGLFAEDYALEQEQLKAAAAKITLSSQRLGEKALKALQQRISEPAESVEESQAEEESPAQQETPPPKAGKKRARRKKNEDPEDFAAALLAETIDPPAPPRVPRAPLTPSNERSAAEADASDGVAMTPTRPVMSAPTPVPTNRPFTPSPSTGSGFKPAPKTRSRSGGGFKLNVDPKIAMGVAGVLAVAVGGWFLWGILFPGEGPAPAIYERAAFMWAKVNVLKQKKDATDEDWKKLEADLSTNITMNLNSLRPYTRSSQLAQKLYLFENDGLKEILKQGKKTPPNLFEEAQGYLDEAKKLLPKKK